MDAKSLMIGDLVRFKDDLEAVKINAYGLCNWIFNNIIPIPLTEEILKANGFILKQNIFGLAWWREEWVFKCSENKVIYITDGNGHGKDILYVHEFQHALRLCGLTHLADNFKIE